MICEVPLQSYLSFNDPLFERLNSHGGKQPFKGDCRNIEDVDNCLCLVEIEDKQLKALRSLLLSLLRMITILLMRPPLNKEMNSDPKYSTIRFKLTYSFLIMARKMLIDGELGNATEEEAHYDFDLFVIGAGSGGVRAARFSAQYGAKKVGICELPFHPISSEVVGGVGGTCVIRGCVPKKILVYGASFGPELEDARNYGWELNEKIDFNWKKLLQKKTEEIIRLNGIYKRLLSNAGVKLFEGEGKVVGPNEVEVTQLDGTKLRYSAKYILIATGSRAQRPDIPGQELAITSDEALSLDELPKRVVVLGGGYIAVEFASIWRGMGATVDLYFRKELPLRGFDDEMRAAVARNLEGRGISLHPRTTLTELVKTEDGVKALTDHGEELIADVVLFATGNSMPSLFDFF
ncbi:unnamed protein product [Ilex paraguariensis]|uniref:glutathione-disulfide reductase n=1 Tax=Ilex paraguariensis TaxID=185542 RepID=A0ABC8U248_9AQUA